MPDCMYRYPPIQYPRGFMVTFYPSIVDVVTCAVDEGEQFVQRSQLSPDGHSAAERRDGARVCVEDGVCCQRVVGDAGVSACVVSPSRVDPLVI